MSCYVKQGKLICNNEDSNEDNNEDNIEHFRRNRPVQYCVPKWGACSKNCGGGKQIYTGKESYSGSCPGYTVGVTEKDCNTHSCDPTGSYKYTCEKCTHNNRTLTCSCKTNRKKWNTSTRTCDNNKFKNINGQLRCE